MEEQDARVPALESFRVEQVVRTGGTESKGGARKWEVGWDGQADSWVPGLGFPPPSKFVFCTPQSPVPPPNPTHNGHESLNFRPWDV